MQHRRRCDDRSFSDQSGEPPPRGCAAKAGSGKEFCRNEAGRLQRIPFKGGFACIHAHASSWSNRSWARTRRPRAAWRKNRHSASGRHHREPLCQGRKDCRAVGLRTPRQGKHRRFRQVRPAGRHRPAYALWHRHRFSNGSPQRKPLRRRRRRDHRWNVHRSQSVKRGRFSPYCFGCFGLFQRGYGSALRNRTHGTARRNPAHGARTRHPHVQGLPQRHRRSDSFHGRRVHH